MLLLAEAQVTAITDIHHGQQSTSAHTVHDVLLRTRLVVDMRAGVPVGLQPEDTVAVASRNAFDDDADALYALTEELSDAIPGLEFPDDWPSEGDQEFERDVNGHHVHVAYSLVDAGEWTVQVSIDDADPVEIGCFYDVNARV